MSDVSQSPQFVFQMQKDSADFSTFQTIIINLQLTQSGPTLRDTSMGPGEGVNLTTLYICRLSFQNTTVFHYIFKKVYL